MERVYETVITFVLGVIVGAFLASIMTQEGTVDQCKKFGAFSANGHVYTCKVREAA